MIPNPIRKVLSTLRSHRVKFLLMGGQACVLYGAAEFSRDTDIILLADAANLRRLAAALRELRAECIAVPPLAPRYLRKGHAVHFRCHHPDAAGMRLDIMARLRGVASFGTLWKRRSSVELESGLTCDVISLPDLVQAKKTQRDKDWFMLRRLMEAHYVQHQRRPSKAQVLFWLREVRTPSLLCQFVREHPQLTERVARERPLLVAAKAGSEPVLEAALRAEEERERESDRAYWRPLRQEMESLRRKQLKSKTVTRCARRSTRQAKP